MPGVDNNQRIRNSKMQIKTQPSQCARRVALVTLDTAEEHALTAAELMLIVDNHEGVTYDPATARYKLNGKPFGGARHFGGSVEPTDNPAVRRVTVYVD